MDHGNYNFQRPEKVKIDFIFDKKKIIKKNKYLKKKENRDKNILLIKRKT